MPDTKALERLGRLLKSGQLTQEEFDSLRAKALGEITDSSITVPDYTPPQPDPAPKVAVRSPAPRPALRIDRIVMVATIFAVGVIIGRLPFLRSSRPEPKREMTALPQAVTRPHLSPEQLKKEQHRLAKEAFTHGYILESMNRIEEAKAYYKRALEYASKDDPLYERIQTKVRTTP